MPTVPKSKALEVRRIAFAALVRQGKGRFAVQEALGIKRSEYYRLRKALEPELADELMAGRPA